MTQLKRDMSMKAVRARIKGYVAHAAEMLKDLPDIYKPGSRQDESSSDEEDGDPVAARNKRKLEFEKRRQALIKRGLIGEATRAQSRQELEERLQAKLASFNPRARGSEMSEKKKVKLAKRTLIAEKKRERKEEKKKEAKKRSRQRNKTKKKEAKMADDSGQVASTDTKPTAQARDGSGPREQKKTKEKAEVKSRPQDDQIAFSKFDFAGSGNDGNTKKANKSLKKVLASLEKTKEKQKKLEEKGDKEALKSLKEKTSWENALSKAEGQKVRTDLSLVKKSLKRQEKKKKASSKKWESRLEHVADTQSQRQEKRQANLKSRRESKIKKKVKRSIKKGRVIF